MKLKKRLFIKPEKGIHIDHDKCLITVKEGKSIGASINTEGLTPEQAKKTKWIISTFKGRPSNRLDYHPSVSEGSAAIRFHISSVAEGGGLIWIEPVLEGEEPTYETPNGYYIKCIGKTNVVQVEWREQNKKEKYPIIQGDKFFFEGAQLHIYTRGMYGNNIRVYLVDKNLFFKDKELLVSNPKEVEKTLNYFKRQVGKVKDVIDPSKTYQKAVVDIWFDPQWVSQAKEKELELYPVIVTEKKGEKNTLFKFKENAVTIRFRRGGEREIVYAEKQGNKPVSIGNVYTDPANFDSCRYQKIIKKYPETSDLVLFSFSDGISVEKSTIDIGVVASKSSKKKLTIALEGLNVKDCIQGKHQESKVFDITALQEDYPKASVTNDGKLSFVPKYSYEYVEPVAYLDFLLAYFPFFSKVKEYIIPVETCAFEKDVRLSILPDTAFAMHFQIGKPEDYTGRNKIYYRNMQVPLVRGIRGEIEQYDKIRKKVTEYLPFFGPLQDMTFSLLLEYLKEESENYAVGIHGYHSFTDDQKATIIDYSKEYPIVPKMLISFNLLISVIVDALIAYVSGGGSVALKAGKGAQTVSKLSKVKNLYKIGKKGIKYIKLGKKINSLQIVDPARPNSASETEFIGPALSRIIGVGHVNNPDGTSGIELLDRVDAAPLFALNHKIENSLGALAAGFVGITRTFDIAEQALGVVGTLRTLKEAKKDYKKVKEWRKKRKEAKKHKENGTLAPVEEKDNNKQEEESFTFEKYFSNKRLQEGLDKLEKDIQKKIDDKIFTYFGAKAQTSMYFLGYYDVFYEIRVNTVTQKMQLEIQDSEHGKLNYQSDKKLTYGRDYGIAFGITIEATIKNEVKWSKLNNYLPDFLGVALKDHKYDVEFKGEAKGALNFERSFTWTDYEKSPKEQDTLIFTGIVLTVYVKIEAEERKDGENWDEVKNIEIGKKKLNKNTQKEENIPVMLEIIPSFTINMKEKDIFDTETWINLIK